MDTSERIIAAAEQVMRDRGLARTTIREIARAAGLSEGALYRHFSSKEDLFLSVLKHSPSNFIRLLMSLPERVGTGSVLGNVREVLVAALDFYRMSLPMSASLFSEPGLLARNREAVRERNAGPQKSNEELAAYLRAEQGQGRLPTDLDPEAISMLLLGACFQQAFLSLFMGEDIAAEDRGRFVDAILQAFARGLDGNA